MRRFPLVVSLIPLVLAACANKPVATQPEAVKPVAQTSMPMQEPKPVAPPSVATALPEYLDPNSALNREHSVYFKFDDSGVGPEYKAVVERHGQFLAQHPSVKTAVQGNADERGSAEYNLALGQRRADAVKQALEIYGAKDSQIEATSFGSEKPVAAGHDESAWSKNRRADIVYSQVRG
jgi:peptidoglycan-associated lipoprotein